MSVQSLVGSAALKSRGVPTAVSLVLDRSASMSPWLNEIIQGVSSFIEDQKQSKGLSYVTISQFDHNYDNIFQHSNIKEINFSEFEKQYRPRGSTALYDAIVQAIADIDAHLNTLNGKEKPKRVVVALVTDGEDNVSTNTTAKVKNLIRTKQDLGWDFFLLGAENGLDTQNVAGKLGISDKHAADFSSRQIQKGIELLSAKVKEARQGKKQLEITQGERRALLGAPRSKEEL